MCLMGVSNLKEIDQWKNVFSWLKVILLNWCKEEKYQENWTIFRDMQKVLCQFLSNLKCEVVYMEGIKYVNLIEICPIVRDMRC